MKAMEKIVISPGEISEAKLLPEELATSAVQLPAVVPSWAKLSLVPLVLALPLLCLVSIILRVAMRSLPPRTRHGWTSLQSLLGPGSPHCYGIITLIDAKKGEIKRKLVTCFSPRMPKSLA